MFKDSKKFVITEKHEVMLIGAILLIWLIMINLASPQIDALTEESKQSCEIAQTIKIQLEALGKLDKQAIEENRALLGELSKHTSWCSLKKAMNVVLPLFPA